MRCNGRSWDQGRGDGLREVQRGIKFLRSSCCAEQRGGCCVVNVVEGGLHLANFFAPAFGVGLLTATLVKLIWWREVTVAWGRLAVTGCFACALALIFGLVVFGSDGKMVTYGLMLLLCTVSIVWIAFRPSSR
jgi:hypothetical protein